jgi:hypothetical protein
MFYEDSVLQGLTKKCFSLPKLCFKNQFEENKGNLNKHIPSIPECNQNLWIYYNGFLPADILRLQIQRWVTFDIQ